MRCTTNHQPTTMRKREAMKMKKCKFCGREPRNNPSDYYHRKQCEALSINARIKHKQYDSEAELRRLEKKLEFARYVGD